MTKEMVFLSPDILESFIRDAFVAMGVPTEEAAVCANVLITSDLHGVESHGIGRLKYYYERIKAGQHQVLTNLEVVRESPTTAVVDGHHGMGMIIGTRCMQMAIDKAKQYGMGSVAVRNSTHFGIAGYYPMMAAKAGLIGMTFTNARPSINPTFGVKPMLGTNPIAFGAPTDEAFPFLFDAATSITQRGKIEVLSRAEKPVPSGWVTDNNGQPLTNADAVLDGLSNESAALLPLGGMGELLGGHKGYGLATMVEIFSASLQTGHFLYGLTGIGSDGAKTHFNLGHFFMAINVESFTSLEEFKKTTGDILRDLRNSTKAPEQTRIYTAGEKEFEMEKHIRKQGVAINNNLQKELLFVKKELGLTQYQFPF